MAKLGENRLGSIKFSQPVAFDAETDAVRQRAEEHMKSPFPTHDGTVWDKMLTTILTSARIHNSVAQDIIDARFVDTATQKQLDMIAELFHLERKPNERDEKFRARIKTQLPRYTTTTTIDEILQISATLLKTDPQRITVVEEPDIEPARFDIHIEDIVFDETTITVDEYEELIQDVKAAGVKAFATIGQQFTHRSVSDYDDGINAPDKGYSGYTADSINSVSDGPDTLVDNPTELDVGAPYADEITQQLT